MAEWGLEAGTDYNTQDVEIGQLLGDIEANPQIKKRKYDFIIPYQSRESGAKVFVQSQFYTVDEIDTALKAAIRNAVLSDNDFLTISRDRESIVRKYCILDTIANYGQPIPADSTAGYLTVPGYSTYWGLLQAAVIKRALEIAPILNSLWRSHLEPFDDIQWLLEKGFVKTK